ncbi:MAG: hypothetical protein Q9202_000977 [Teloschistes flavicans]
MDLSREHFVNALEAHGLSVVDILRSTGLLNELPIFSHMHEAIPRYGDGPWHDPQPNEMFPTALAFYERAIKLPMWATPADWPIVEHYGSTFVKVAEDMLGYELPRKATRMPDRPIDAPRSMMARAKL